ncbi:MAG: homoserine dehydrogenase [Candidatus Omnitrophica bacterium]|nr:homoserine dehydrogenase [Candidatus Omnitrophota bacterium]
MKKINLGLIGFGHVGSGVVKILRDKKSFLTKKLGVQIRVKKICDKDIASKRNVSVGKGILTRNPQEILKDPQIDIVVELIGGIHPAKEYILEALKKGKHVVTANKALLSEAGRELFAFAQDMGKSIYFEASVGAGIPIIKSLREGLVANKFNAIFGIVNGTSNFILSQMSKQQITFSCALREAKARGFAERNPILDIAGIDSAHKLILLTYLCFGRFVDLRDVFVEGITEISLADVNYAKELGLEIKLLAIAKKEDNELEVRVHPTLIPNNHLLASVGGVDNALYVSSDLAGNLLFYGPGAGQMPAASAVVADLVDLTQDIRAGLFRPTLNIVEDKSIKRLRKIDEIESRYYIRFMAKDLPGVLAKISGVLARFGISIASVTQKERRFARVVPIVMIIHEAKEKNLRLALEVIDRLEVIKQKSVAIRMEEVY